MVEFEDDGVLKLVNSYNVTQVFVLNTGKVRMNLMDGTYIVTSEDYFSVKKKLIDSE